MPDANTPEINPISLKKTTDLITDAYQKPHSIQGTAESKENITNKRIQLFEENLKNVDPPFIPQIQKMIDGLKRIATLDDVIREEQAGYFRDFIERTPNALSSEPMLLELLGDITLMKLPYDHAAKVPITSDEHLTQTTSNDLWDAIYDHKGDREITPELVVEGILTGAIALEPPQMDN